MSLMMKVEDAVLKRGEEEDAELMEDICRGRMAKKDPRRMKVFLRY